MDVHISREGESLGTRSLSEMETLVQTGELKESDFVWHERLEDWTELKVFLSEKWKWEPATEEQLGFLRSMGVDLKEGMTKGEASDLLSQLTGDDVASSKTSDENHEKDGETSSESIDDKKEEVEKESKNEETSSGRYDLSSELAHKTQASDLDKEIREKVKTIAPTLIGEVLFLLHCVE